MIQTQATVVNIEHSPNGQVAFVYFKPEQSFTFQEGQFIFLERLGFSYPDGKAMKNAYSIGTTNILLQEQGILGTIVKKSSEGGMSEYLTQGIKIGGTIKITGPLGHFIDKKLSKNYLFVSIGSGITPLFSLYNHLIQMGGYNKIVNVFGERTQDNLLSSVMQTYSEKHEQVEQLLYLSQEKNLPEHWKLGRVQLGLEHAYSHFGGDTFQAFLCGKPEMVDSVVTLLLAQGVEKEYITFEKY